MPNIINTLLFSEMDASFKGRDSLLVVTLDGLTAEDSHSLRGKLKEQGVSLRVIKNRVASKVFQACGVADLGGHLAGMCAVAYGEEDGAAITAAKVIEEAMKPHKKVRPVNVRTALLDGEILPPEAAVQMHTMPDKNTVRAMIVGTIQAPLRSLAAVLAAPASSVTRAINARAEGEES